MKTENLNLISTYTSDLSTDNFNVLGTTSMIERSEVPLEHVKIADNFMLIKKLFGFSAIKSKISFEERKYLAEYNLNLLESSTMIQINDEIMIIKNWGKSGSDKLQRAAINIMQIRSKELKYLISSSYRDIIDEKYNGYKSLERYFEVISKY